MDLDLIAQIQRAYPGGNSMAVDLRLSFAGARVTVLFGPSGSGKTTLLRCLAGLEQPDRGMIRYGGEIWCDTTGRILLPPQKRRVGYMFQEYALFPHLTVSQNLEYGLAANRREPRGARVAAMLSLFNLEELKDRYPRRLSGGEMQRVALARAVAPEPKLLLLDEPLSALDAPARARLRGEIRTLLLRIGIPVLLVTHDRTEAIALGDQIAVMVDGRIEQVGPVQEVFNRPANTAVARSVGVETVLPGCVLGKFNGLLAVKSGQQMLSAVDHEGFAGADVYLCIRAEDVILERGSPGKDSARNHLPGRIVSVVPEGPLVRVALDCGIPLTALITRQSREDLGLEAGEAVTAVIKATSVHLVSRESSGPGDRDARTGAQP